MFILPQKLQNMQLANQHSIKNPRQKYRVDITIILLNDELKCNIYFRYIACPFQKIYETKPYPNHHLFVMNNSFDGNTRYLVLHEIFN